MLFSTETSADGSCFELLSFFALFDRHAVTQITRSRSAGAYVQ